MNLCALNLAVYCACKRDKNGNERRSPRVLKAHTAKWIQRCTMRTVNITIYENTGKRTKLFCCVSCFSLLSFYALFYINKRETYNYTFSIGNACALMYACMLRYLCVYVVHPWKRMIMLMLHLERRLFRKIYSKENQNGNKRRRKKHTERHESER